MCGVFGCIFPQPVESIGKALCYGLIALQHRGQEAAGISVVRNQSIFYEKDFGMVNQVFSEDKMNHLSSASVGIAHVRYSTFGSHNDPSHIQPVFSERHNFTMVFNGTIAQPVEIISSKYSDKNKSDISDTMLIMEFLETKIESGEYTLEESLVLFSTVCSGAFSMIVMANSEEVYVLRDNYGYRPLQIAFVEYENQKGFLISSEDCAFKLFNYSKPTNVKPGSIIKIFKEDSKIVSKTIKTNLLKTNYQQKCAFEMVYFSRPDSHFDNTSVSDFREKLGIQLFEEIKSELDIEIGLSAYRVIGVPDSSTQTAVGFCNASGARFTIGLNKNRYIHRTFIQPTQEMRENMVRMKLNIIPEKIQGERIILIDDSLIRGTTMCQIVNMIRSAKPKEIIVLIACPPVKNKCFFGMDFKTRNEMIANRVANYEDDPTDAICKTIGADKLLFLSLNGTFSSFKMLIG